MFDGIGNLFDLPPPAPAEPAPPQPGLFDGPSRGPSDPQESVDRSAAPPPAGEPIAPEEPAPAVVAPAITEAVTEGEGAPARPEPVLEDFLAEPAPRGRRLANAVWGLLALGALASLVFQAAVRYRAEIAVVAPQARGALEAACQLARCELGLPRRVELVTIESSELQADPRRENLIQLEAVIRNRAPFAQEFPALELTLTDDADRPVVRRVLTPAEYLGAAAPQTAAGMPPQSETPLRMRFDNSQARATGYKLYLFYP